MLKLIRSAAVVALVALASSGRSRGDEGQGDHELQQLRQRARELMRGASQASGNTIQSAGDDCNELLRQGVFNRVAISSNWAVREQWELWLSEQSWSSVESSLGGQWLGIGFGGEGTEERFKSWQQDYRGTHQEHFSYEQLVMVADAGIVNGYVECVGRTSSGLWLVARLPPGAPPGGDVSTILLELGYRNAPRQPAKIKIKEATIVGAKPVLTADGKTPLLFTQDSEIESGGSVRGQIQREGDEAKRPAITITFNTDLGLSASLYLAPFKRRVYRDEWREVDDAGLPYFERFQYTGPNRDNVPAELVSKTFELSNPKAEILSVTCEGIAGPLAWDKNPDNPGREPWIAIAPDRKSFTIRRTHISFPTTYRYFAKLRILRRVLVEE